MSSTLESVCRVCLVVGSSVHSVDDKHLLETFEKLTRTQLNTEDGMPGALCYICIAHLQRCCRFSELALRADGSLRDLLHNHIEVTHNTIATLNHGISHQLSKTAARCVSTDDCNASNISKHNFICMYESLPLAVKEEQVAVKEETTKQEIFIEIKRDTEGEAATNSLEERSLKGSYESTNKNTKELHLRCDTCSKKFNKSLDLKKHLQSHAAPNPFACTACSRTFKHAGHLTRHARSHVKAYICDRCSKRFKLKSALEAHIRIHTGEKPFACEACGKTFNQNSHLKTHASTHTGAKPFPCETCGKAFRQRAQLASHARTHSGERPFSCDACNATFGHLTTLRKHKRLHVEVKTHACSLCALSFDRESSLRAHVRLHSAERPHSCTACDKRFLQARHLKEHVTSVHGARRMHACRVCGNKYKRPEHLKQHARSAKCLPMTTSTLVLSG